jgi:hypothetical protein
VHLRKLGGLRHARRASPNTGWRNASFRGFADYMQTPDLDAGLNRLIKLAKQERTVQKVVFHLKGKLMRIAIRTASSSDSNTPKVFGFEISQQNQQLDLEGGCNAFIPRDFVVRGSCSIPTAPTSHPIC